MLTSLCRASVGVAVAAAAVVPQTAEACGAYFGKRTPVASAGTLNSGPTNSGAPRPTPTTTTSTSDKLFNKSTKMVFVRDGDQSTITKTADYRGDPKEFAVVIAVPTLLTREQIQVGDAKLIAALDRMTAPKVSVSRDADPCPVVAPSRRPNSGVSRSAPGARPSAGASPTVGASPRALPPPVTVEAEYAVGEYDVAVLSATQAAGLLIWLNEQGYAVPPSAEPILATYIAEGLKFFVAKVNLARQQDQTYSNLSPLQISYRSPKFWVPLRLSTVNAEGPQDMIVFALTRQGRVEAANFQNRIVRAGSEDVPPLVLKDFDGFVEAAFERMSGGPSGRFAVVEAVRAWGIARDPTGAIFEKLGAGWANVDNRVVLTRLHLRYDRDVKTDLLLVETQSAFPFQATYAVRHGYAGAATCPAGLAYRQQLAARETREMSNLVAITGWSPATIQQMQSR